MKPNKPSLGFVFFGQNRTEKYYKEQLREIKIAQDTLVSEGLPELLVVIILSISV